MTRFVRMSALAIPLVAFATACGEDTLVPEVDEPDPTTEQEAALVAALQSITDRIGFASDAAGPMEYRDESPAFGDAVFAEAFGASTEGPEVGVDVATDAEIVPFPDATPIYHVMAVWGRLRPNPNRDWFRLRWDPVLRVAEGDAVRVRRSIFFEPGDVVHPQEVRHIVKISSITGPHVDGVIAQVALQPRLTLEPTDAIVTRPVLEDAFLAFESEPFSVTIPASKLEDLSFAEIIDDTGNGVLLSAVRRPGTPCAVGFMAGRWARTSNTGGVFGGIWHQANGRREGYVVGRWGVTATGEPRFRGKVVNLQGEFLAFMSGKYGNGVYEGELHGRDGTVLGQVRGRYSGEDGHGLFHGVWQQVCPEPPPRCWVTADGVRICQVDPVPESTP